MSLRERLVSVSVQVSNATHLLIGHLIDNPLLQLKLSWFSNWQLPVYLVNNDWQSSLPCQPVGAFSLQTAGMPRLSQILLEEVALLLMKVLFVRV